MFISKTTQKPYEISTTISEQLFGLVHIAYYRLMLRHSVTVNTFLSNRFAGRIKFVNFVLAMSYDKNIKPCPRDIFSEYLSKHNKRRTPERFAILDSAMSTPEHFTIDSFHDRLENEGFHVSLATVYSTLELLVDCGLVRRHRFGSDSARYERTTGSVNHHHLVCTRCGKVKEVRDAALGDAISSIRYPGFSANYFSLNIYGICRACQKRERRTAASAHDKKNNSSISNIRNRKK